MDLVQPIRDRDKILQLKTELMKESYRDYVLFTLGINTGLRISDILPLQVKDIKNSHIVLIEQKSKRKETETQKAKAGKQKRAFITEELRAVLDDYTRNMQPNDYLFPSARTGLPITRTQAYRRLSAAAEKIGIENLGTHSMRKTFGYFHYQQNKDVALLQDLFNHSAPSVTLKYLGLNQDAMDNSQKGLFL